MNLGLYKNLTFNSGKKFPSATGGDVVYDQQDPNDGFFYRYHEFRTTGTTLNFEVQNGGEMDILVVGGGGGGGKGSSSGFGGFAQSSGGGGGAGAMIEHSTKIGNGTHSITVGSGGAKHTGSSGPLVGNDGNSSTFENSGGSTTISITATGGGGGAAWVSGSINGRSGGSGGGGSVVSSTAGTGGVADSYNGVGSKYGSNGGNGFPTGDRTRSSGGGGGASENGTNGASNKGGNGGDGRQWANGRYFSGGGGGGTAIGGTCIQKKGIGGIGGGGNGGSHPDTGGCGDLVATDGTANTGGGGGGGNGWGSASGAGGSGIVIVRYRIKPYEIPEDPLVTNGLVLHLDAGDPASYPGSGTTWTDLSGNSLDMTILQDVSYSTTPSRFVFPTSTSTNSRIFRNHNSLFNYSHENWAYSFWIKQLVDDNGNWAQIFIKGNDGGNRRPGVWFTNGATRQLHITWNASGQTQQTLNTTSNFMSPTNTWHNIVIQSRNSVMMAFKNGVQDANTLTIAARNTNSDPLHIGHRGGFRTLNMEISNFLLYDRSLSDEEISQNFNALRGRYGV